MRKGKKGVILIDTRSLQKLRALMESDSLVREQKFESLLFFLFCSSGAD